jgi:ankyrin repeat protein
MYFKVLNKNLNQKNFQYKVGKNDLDRAFESKPKSCDPGGLYYTTKEFIHQFFELGDIVYIVKVPDLDSTGKPTLFMKDPQKDKYRCSCLELTNEFYTISDFIVKYDIIHHSSLFWAINKGYLNLVEFLIENGVDVHVAYEYPVGNAATLGYLEIVEYLLLKGANKPTALCAAARSGHLKIVEYVIKQGIDLKEFGYFPLEWSINLGFIEITKCLLENGADVNSNDNLLEGAIDCGQFESIKNLVEYGIEIKTKHLELALEHGSIDIFKYLSKRFMTTFKIQLGNHGNYFVLIPINNQFCFMISKNYITGEQDIIKLRVECHALELESCMVELFDLIVFTK